MFSSTTFGILRLPIETPEIIALPVFKAAAWFHAIGEGYRLKVKTADC